MQKTLPPTPPPNKKRYFNDKILVCWLREREKYCPGEKIWNESTIYPDELANGSCVEVEEKYYDSDWESKTLRRKYWKYHCSRRAGEYLGDGSCVGIAEQVDWGKGSVDYHRNYEDHNQHHLSRREAWDYVPTLADLWVRKFFSKLCFGSFIHPIYRGFVAKALLTKQSLEWLSHRDIELK